MSPDSEKPTTVITGAMRSHVGRLSEPWIVLVEQGAITRYAEAIGDPNPLYWGEEYARASSYGSIIVHGALKAAWLGQFVTQWAGNGGRLCRLATQDRGMDAPRPMRSPSEPEDGETWHCRGKVVRKYRKDGQTLVDLEV